MTTSTLINSSWRSRARDLFRASRRYFAGRRWLLLPGTVVLIGGLAFSWNWLVAAGFAALLLSALPCLAMCALGLCMHKMGSRSCSSDTAAPPAPESGENRGK